MPKPDRAVYTPQDFIQWRAAGALDITPKFQRRGVWTPAARSYFIDTLVRQMPIPPIYIRVTQGTDSRRVIRQIIDGQQRVAAALGFIEGEYKLSKTLSAPWGGKTFDSLTPTEQSNILSYGFSSEIFQGISDLEVLEIFARLNTYSVALNAQELRNGRYFGLFKQLAYSLALEHLEFWRTQGIFTERRIARMLEVELTSELLIAQIDGMQDKKKSVDLYYAKFDDTFRQRTQSERRFRDIVDTITETFPDTLAGTEFHRTPLFYSLFATVYHRIHGLPALRLKSPKRALSRPDRVALRGAAEKLSEFIAAGRESEPVPPRYTAFVAACLRQTDNISPREIRLRTLYSEAFGG